MTTSPYISLRSGLDFMLSEHVIDCHRPHPARVFFTAERIRELQRLVARIGYRDWKVVVVEEDGMAWIQVQTFMEDSRGGDFFENNSRHIFLCPDMNDAFGLDLARLLIAEFEMHEAAEYFRLDGEQVYFPHAPDAQPVAKVLALEHRRPGEIAAA